MSEFSDLQTIHCLLCQAIFTYSQSEAHLYLSHLKIEHRVYFYTSWIVNKTVEEESALRDQGEEIANQINDYQLSIANESPLTDTDHDAFGEHVESEFSERKVVCKEDENVEMQEEYECLECNDWYSTDTFDQHFILVPLCSKKPNQHGLNTNNEDIIVNKEIQKKIDETYDFYEETFDEVEDMQEHTQEGSEPVYENALKFRYEANLGEAFDYDTFFNEDEISSIDCNEEKMENDMVLKRKEDGTDFVYEDANYIVQRVNRRLFEKYEFEDPLPVLPIFI